MMASRKKHLPIIVPALWGISSTPTRSHSRASSNVTSACEHASACNTTPEHTGAHRDGYSEDKCRDVLVRICSHIPRNYNYADGLQLVYEKLREYMGDENLDLSSGVLFELIEVPSQFTSDEGAAFRRWMYDHSHRNGDLENGHVPRLGNVVVAPVVPTERLRLWREGHSTLNEVEGSEASIFKEYQRYGIKGRSEWQINHTMYVSSRLEGTRVVHCPTASELHELSWNQGHGRGGTLIGKRTILDDNESPLRDTAMKVLELSCTPPEPRTVQTLISSSIRKITVTICGRAHSFLMSVFQQGGEESLYRTDRIPSPRNDLEFGPYRPIENCPLPAGVTITAQFARKHELIRANESFPDTSDIQNKQCAEDLAIVRGILCNERVAESKGRFAWEYKGPETAQMFKDDGSMAYNWLTHSQSLPVLGSCKSSYSRKGQALGIFDGPGENNDKTKRASWPCSVEHYEHPKGVDEGRDETDFGTFQSLASQRDSSPSPDANQKDDASHPCLSTTDENDPLCPRPLMSPLRPLMGQSSFSLPDDRGESVSPSKSNSRRPALMSRAASDEGETDNQSTVASSSSPLLQPSASHVKKRQQSHDHEPLTPETGSRKPIKFESTSSDEDSVGSQTRATYAKRGRNAYQQGPMAHENQSARFVRTDELSSDEDDNTTRRLMPYGKRDQQVYQQGSMTYETHPRRLAESGIAAKRAEREKRIQKREHPDETGKQGSRRGSTSRKTPPRPNHYITPEQSPESDGDDESTSVRGFAGLPSVQSMSELNVARCNDFVMTEDALTLRSTPIWEEQMGRYLPRQSMCGSKHLGSPEKSKQNKTSKPHDSFEKEDKDLPRRSLNEHEKIKTPDTPGKQMNNIENSLKTDSVIDSGVQKPSGLAPSVVVTTTDPLVGCPNCAPFLHTPIMTPYIHTPTLAALEGRGPDPVHSPPGSPTWFVGAILSMQREIQAKKEKAAEFATKVESNPYPEVLELVEKRAEDISKPDAGAEVEAGYAAFNIFTPESEVYRLSQPVQRYTLQFETIQEEDSFMLESFDKPFKPAANNNKLGQTSLEKGSTKAPLIPLDLNRELPPIPFATFTNSPAPSSNSLGPELVHPNTVDDRLAPFPQRATHPNKALGDETDLLDHHQPELAPRKLSTSESEPVWFTDPELTSPVLGVSQYPTRTSSIFAPVTPPKRGSSSFSLSKQSSVSTPESPSKRGLSSPPKQPLFGPPVVHQKRHVEDEADSPTMNSNSRRRNSVSGPGLTGHHVSFQSTTGGEASNAANSRFYEDIANSNPYQMQSGQEPKSLGNEVGSNDGLNHSSKPSSMMRSESTPVLGHGQRRSIRTTRRTVPQFQAQMDLQVGTDVSRSPYHLFQAVPEGVETDSGSPSVGQNITSPTPGKQLFGERGILGKSTDPNEPPSAQYAKAKPKTGVMSKVKSSMAKLVGKGSSNLTGLDQVPTASTLISLAPSQQAKVCISLALMISDAVNRYLKIEFEAGRMTLDSIEAIVNMWKNKGRDLVVEFRYDHVTQVMLIAANAESLRFYGDLAGSAVQTHAMLRKWKKFAEDMSVRTFCATDSAIGDQISFTYRIFSLLGVEQYFLEGLDELQAFVTGAVGYTPKTHQVDSFNPFSNPWAEEPRPTVTRSPSLRQSIVNSFSRRNGGSGRSENPSVSH